MCAKKVEPEGNKFFCKKCGQVPSASHRFKQKLGVIDDTGTIILMMWDRDAAKMIGKSANDLKNAVSETSGVADDSSIPIEIENLIEKRYMFKVDVQSSNCENQDEIFKVLTFTDDEGIIEKYIPSPRAETFIDPDFNQNQVSHEDNEITDSTEDAELIDIASTPVKIAITGAPTVAEEDPVAQLSGNKIKRVFKKKKIA
ncbi:uncharacterized protein LOC132617583 isoform X1 [Lycium barbarum]|uniref:uncharacterized protein LOC132617583 isoform X1 n=1 Tax=Lycium barbarum TaxID=112863 RepID=UPI00293EFFC4|nr:uncharacterized protein LOC132617583 isoform X1 [Lycium barbarum]